MERAGTIEERSVVRLENVKKSFDVNDKSTEVIGGINLDIEKNEFVVLFGAGQCGKTTLLKMIAG